MGADTEINILNGNLWLQGITSNLYILGSFTGTASSKNTESS